MSQKIQKRERLMNLISVLLSSEDPTPFRDIAGKVVGYDDSAGEEALEKRFDRDKVDLRQLGIPIHYVMGEDGSPAGYVVRREDVFQEKVTFTPQESLLLSIAGRVGSSATGGGALEDALKSALRKLAVDQVGHNDIEGLVPVTTLRTCSGAPESQENVATVTRALTEGRLVRFRYQGIQAGMASQRLLSPYGLGLRKGAWYLVGWCHLREQVRSFRVSRVLGKVRMEGEAGAVAVPDDFSVHEHLATDAWDFGSSEPEDVQIWVPRSQVDGLDLPSPDILETRGDRVLLRVQLRRPEALVPWILSSGGSVRVEVPHRLREQVADAARRLLASYRGEDQAVDPVEAIVAQEANS